LKKIPNISFDTSDNTTDIQFLDLVDLFEKVKQNPTHNPKKPHRIDFFALLVVTSGTGNHQIDLKKYPVKNGTVLKIAKGQVHSFQENLSYKGYLIIFTEEFVLEYFSKSSIDFISHLYNYHLSDPIVENSNFNESFIQKATTELLGKNTYLQKNIVAKYLELYLLKLERISHDTVAINPDKKYYMLFFQFKNLVEKNYKESRNVKDFAEMLLISTKHLNKIVQIFTLSSAKKFIDNYVILEIKRTILSTNNSLKEIAFDLGFDEVTNFTKFFKKHTGFTPKEYKSNI
jgi:AraC-like DNA-binding protein